MACSPSLTRYLFFPFFGWRNWGPQGSQLPLGDKAKTQTQVWVITEPLLFLCIYLAALGLSYNTWCHQSSLQHEGLFRGSMRDLSFPGGSVAKDLPAVQEMGTIPGLGVGSRGPLEPLSASSTQHRSGSPPWPGPLQLIIRGHIPPNCPWKVGKIEPAIFRPFFWVSPSGEGALQGQEAWDPCTSLQRVKALWLQLHFGLSSFVRNVSCGHTLNYADKEYVVPIYLSWCSRQTQDHIRLLGYGRKEEWNVIDGMI